MPGMVNAYDLVAINPFHGPGEDMTDSLFRDLPPLVRKIVTPKMMHIRTALAAWNSIHTGVTTFTDMYYSRPKWARSTTPQTNIGRKKHHE